MRHLLKLRYIILYHRTLVLGFSWSATLNQLLLLSGLFFLPLFILTKWNTLKNRASNEDNNNRQTMPPLVQLDSDNETRKSEKLESSYMRRRLRYWRSLLEQGSCWLGFCMFPLHIISLLSVVSVSACNFVTEFCRWWERHRSTGEREGRTKTNSSCFVRVKFFLWRASWSRAG